MKMTIKRVLALVMALAMALPSFALSEDGGHDLPYVEEALRAAALTSDGDADVAEAGTPDEIEEITLEPDDGIVIAEAEETPVEAKEMTLDPDDEADATGAETPEEADETFIDPEDVDVALIDVEDAAPEGFVRVSVAMTPEDAAVAIFDINGETPIEPQLGADWLLVPGTYAYSAWAEGFAAAEREAFKVPEAERAFELEIALRPEEAAETENTPDIEGTTENGDAAEIDAPADEEAIADAETGIIESVENPDEPEEETEEPEEDAIEEIVEADPEEADEAANEEPEEAQPAPFSESKTVDGVVVTVEAEAGAFPAGAVLSVRKVPVATRAEADAAVEEVRADDVNVARSYTFDIAVLDAEGNELQPAEGFAVAVSFALAQVADANLETSVYHITEDDAGELTADRLDAVEDAAAQTVTAETEGFSIYTVEFTYNALQYVLEGGDSVPLSAILSAVGLTGEAESAAVSDEGLLSVAERGGELALESHNPFLTEEWLRVTIGGVAFEIAVTDANAVQTSYTVNDKNVSVTAAAVSYDDTELREETSKWYVVDKDTTLSNRLTITGSVNLILRDGVTLTATEGICLSRGNSLTVYGQADGTGALVVPPKGVDMERAGIGGNRQQSAGAFTLYGGQVTVTGGADGAGIGGGDSGSGGDVTIYGGTLTAQGGLCGAGIGGGLSGSQYGRFVMYDGTVTVTGGNYGAGIGGGENFNDEFGNSAYGGNGGQVSVWGGTLIVTGGKLAAAIGGGKRGSGGSLQVGGSANITATAGAKNKRDNAIQAIGRGQVSTSYDGQSEGSVVLADEAGVTAGDDASTASRIAIYRRAEGCRMPYVRIQAEGTPSYAIDKQINQVLEDRVTDTIDVQNLSGKSIVQAEAGETFRAIVILDEESTFVSLTAAYTLGGEARTLEPNSQTRNGDVVTCTFTMPNAVDGIVTVRAQVARKTYAITLPQNVEHGYVSVVGDRDGEDIRVTDGTRVRLSTIVDANSLDYFIQEIKVTGATSGKVYASLVNDTTTNMTMGEREDEEWLFKMPKEDVVITANFAKGCWYTNLNGVRKVRRYFNTIASGNDLNLNGNGIAAGWYIVPANTTVNITNRVDVTAEVNIILCDGARLNANDGIFVAQRKHARLTIWAQSGSGAIYADATDSSWAGIGGNERDDTGPITINGGHIEAQGGHSAAGISGGQYSETNTVTINVPKGRNDSFTYVKATGGKYGAGIGGGEDRNNDKCVINGGTVYAYGGEHGAGIGGGEGGGNNNIEINGGYVYAKGGELAAGLGGGEHYRGGGFGGKVVINDGEVYAYGGRNGAGIGGGEDGSAATVTVNGGYLYAEGGEYAAGIGGGEHEPGGTFTMNGGEVEAYGGAKAAGIGGAEDEKGGTVTINGGKLLAGGGTDVNCAIGGGKGESDNGSLTIAEGMSVEYGNTKNSYTRANYAERASKAQWSKYALIDACPHPDGKGYEPIDEKQHNTPSCKYCSPGLKAEDHVWGSDGLVCTRCSYNKVHLITVHNTNYRDLDKQTTIEVIADGEVVGNISTVGDYWLGNVREGRSVTVKITPKGGYQFAGDVSLSRNLSSEDVEIKTDDAETGARLITFTMPCGDMSLTCPMELASLKAYFNYSGAMGSVTSYGMADDIATGWMGQTRSFTVRPKNENYTILSVEVCERNADGTDGEPLSGVTRTSGTDYEYCSFRYPETDVNVNILFSRAGTVDIYHVIQTFDANGSPIWPQDAPDPLRNQATGKYTVPVHPAEEALEAGQDKWDYTAVGYKWDSYSSMTDSFTAYTPSYNDPALTITDKHEALLVYYKADSKTLNIYNSGTFDDNNKRESLSVPIGTPLLAYLKAKGYDPGKTSDGTDMKWATGESGKRGYTLLTDASTMPSEDFNIYPVDPREYVHVLLDLGAYDEYIYEGEAEWGDFWGSDWGDVNNTSFGEKHFAYPNYESSSRSELAYMDVDVPRSMRLQVGEALPEDVQLAMANTMRPGWKLTGWKALVEGELVDLEDGMVADPSYFCSSLARTYKTKDGYNGRNYYYMRLVAQWEMRDALVIFDAADGAWSDGDTYRTATIKLGEDATAFTLLSADYPAKNNGGWVVSKWILGKTVNQNIYIPLYNPTLRYKDFSLVADDDLAKTTDPDGKNVIRLKAEYTQVGAAQCTVTFYDRQEDGRKSCGQYATTVPAGVGTIDLSMAVVGDVTRIYDAAGQQVREIANPMRAGYTFLGWAENTDDAAQRYIAMHIERDKTPTKPISKNFFAVWEEQPHNLILDLAGGGWPEGQYIRLSYEYGETLPWDALLPVREHYDFMGWQLADGGELPETMPHADVTATAQWKHHEYTLTFISAGSENYFIRAIKGANIKSRWPADPETREGYVFTGWYPGNLPETMPGYDATYIAKWELVPERPEKPVLEIVDGTTLAVVEPDADLLYSIDGGETWVRPGADGLTFEKLIPGTTYQVIAKVAAIPGVSRESEVSEPAEATMPRFVLVRLNVGGYDLVAATDEDAEHVRKLNLWENYPIGEDTETPVNLTWEQSRQFTKGEGDAIEIGRLANAARAGYALVGWYNQRGVQVETDKPLDAIQVNFDKLDREPAGTPDDPCMLTLTARWMPRNANIKYNVENWEGAAPQGALDVPFGGTATITDARPKASAGKAFAYWTEQNTGRKYYPGGTLAYDSIELVSHYGAMERETDNNTIILTPVFEDKPAVVVPLIIDANGGSAVAPFDITIPAGREDVRVRVAWVEDTNAEFSWGLRVFVDEVELEIETPRTIRRTGHSLTGLTGQGVAKSSDSASLFVTRDQADTGLTLVAEWEANTYTITFDSQGGSDVAAITQDYGTEITAPAKPDKQYYTFERWSPELPETMPAGDLTVKAVWTANEYTIKFYTDRDKVIATITESYGTNIAEQLPADPTWANHVFQGWKMKADDSATGDFVALPETMPGGGADYIAIWLETQDAPDRPEVTGKTHDTLTVKAEKGQAYSIDGGEHWVQPDGDSYTFEGLTPGETYSVITYKPGVKDESVDSPVSAATIVTLPHVIEVRLDVGGYDYEADHADATQKEKLNLWQGYPIGDADDTPVRLDWEQARRFQKDEGETIKMDRLSTATRKGFLLDGWFTKNGTKLESTLGAILDYCDDLQPDGTVESPYIITLTARWTPRDADVTYALGDGALPEGMTADQLKRTVAFSKTAAVSEIAPVAAAGKTFVGWMDKNGRLYRSGETIAYSDLSAVTVLGTHDDATLNNQIALTAEYADLPASVAQLSFSNVDGDVTPVDIAIPKGRDDARVTVAWARVGNTDDWEITVSPDSVDDAQTRVIRRAGHAMNGWQGQDPKGASGSVTLTFTRDQNHRAVSQTLTAAWSKNRYTVTFDTNGGGAVTPASIDYEYGAAIDSSAWQVPDRTHYDFVRWEPDYKNMPAEDVTVAAVWKPSEYTVTFVDGDAILDSVSGVYGAKLTPPADPAKDGEVFKGWSRKEENENRETEPLPAFMPDANTTYYAVWKAANAQRPDKPSVTATSSTVIMVNDPQSGLEYSYSEAGSDDWSDWQKPVRTSGAQGGEWSLTLDQLTPGATYQVRARYAETGDMKASEASEPSDPITTPLPPPDAPKLVPGVGSLSVAEPDAAMEYQCVDADALADEAQYGDWQSPTDGAMTFDGLKESHLYYVRARYKAAAGIALPSKWTAEQTYKTTITGVEIVGEPVVGNTLVAHVTPERMNGDVYYIWTRNDATAGVQCLKEAADSFDALPDGVEIVSEASYVLTEADVGATIRVYAWQFGVPGLIGIAIKPSEAVEVVKREDEDAPEEPESATPAQQEEPEPAAPAAPAVADASAMLILTTRSVGRNALRATWTEIPGADGYDVFYAPCGKNTYKLAGTVTGGAKRALRIRNLRVRHSYKVIVKAYVLSGGEKTYVAQSPMVHCYTHGGSARIVNPGSLKLKKAALTLKPGRTGRISATVKGVRRTGRILKHVSRLRFYSSDSAVATVNKSGMVKAVGRGSCLIYVLTNNGIWKTVNVTVND